MRAGYTHEARSSIEQHGQPDDAAFEVLAAKLRYVDGDYKDAATFATLKAELGNVQHPVSSCCWPPDQPCA